MAGGKNKGRPDLTDADYLAKLVAKCKVLPNGCWEFQGFTSKTSGDPNTPGYGHTSYRGKHWIAHRLSFFLHNGHIDKKLDVLHSCDYPACCNPAHLSQGTDADNIGDAMKRGRPHRGNLMRQKTHCPQGHEYAKHARIDKTRNGSPRRACTICQRAHCRKRAGWPQELLFAPKLNLCRRPSFPSQRSSESK